MKARFGTLVLAYFKALVLSAALLLATGSVADEPTRKLLILGQDLGTVRDYFASGCCPRPDGTTFYINLYDLLDPAAQYGGLGVDGTGRPLEFNRDDGTGLKHGWKAAREFPGGVAIGLELAENNHPGALDDLLAGAYDPQLQHLARFLATLDKSAWLRIGYEFDGAWNQGYADAPRYREVFRHVVTSLREAGAGDTQFVWQAGTSPVDDIIEGRHENIADWYPGDEYVDWVALSFFLRPDLQHAEVHGYQVPTQRQLMDEVLDFARAQHKPVMIAESAPQGYDLARLRQANITAILDGPSGEGVLQLGAEDIWTQWFAPLFDYLERNDDVIHALAYINTHWDAQRRWGPPYAEGYWGDSRLQANPLISQRFSAAIEAWRARP